MKLYYRVTLESDTAFRSRAGAGQFVDFVPGYVLLGRVARQYDAAGDLAWHLFHSGATRFGNGRLLDAAGQPARPLPLSVWWPKGKTGLLATRDASDVSVDPDAGRTGRTDANGTQAWPGGVFAKVRRRFDLKTAINYDTQRAETGKLFRLRVLSRGQSFGGVIHFSGNRAKEAFDFVSEHLPGAARLGWSRRAEYGKVNIELVEQPAAWRNSDQPAAPLRIMLLSETCLLDDAGQPTNRPSPAPFGLTSGTLDLDRSAIRTCRYTPFNMHRRRPDMERVALQAGSVVVFKDAVLDPSRDIEVEGVGVHRAEGCGAVWVNPLTPGEWSTPHAVPAAPLPEVVQPKSDSKLWTWVEAQRRERVSRRAAEAQRQRIVAHIGSAGRPSASQWRRLANEAYRADDRAALAHALFDGPSPVCTDGVAQHQWAPLVKTLRDCVAKNDPLGIALAAEELARAQEASRE